MREPDLLHALYVPFQRTHILINRTQCETGVFAADVEKRDDGNAYFEEVIRIAGLELRIFDLQAYLCNTFRVHSDVAAQLILITPLNRLSEATGAQLQGGPLAATNQEQLALRVSSETAMRSIHLAELRPLGSTMRARLVAHGMVATHSDPQSFGFLIDIDRLLQLSLKEST